MNPSVRLDGTIQALREFFGRDFQEYEPGKVYAPFITHAGGTTCQNPIIIGYIKTGKLAWMEQWIEVCKCLDTGKWCYGINTASDDCEGNNSGGGGYYCFTRLPHPNYLKMAIYDSPEDAIMAAIRATEKSLDERGDSCNKGTRKMLALSREQLKGKPKQVIQLSLFD